MAPTPSRTSKVRVLASGTVPFAFVAVMAAYILGPGADLLGQGVTLPEITVEMVEFADSEIRATVRNTGPVPVTIAMADINDRIQPAAVEPDGHIDRYQAALVRIPFEWNEAEPYTVGITIGDGTRFEREVEAAARAPEPTYELAGLFALVGTYVGIIPVMVGMLWLPFISRIGKGRYHFFLAMTAGLLLFLGIDSVEEAVGIAGKGLAESFNGALLVVTVVVLSFLGLYIAGERIAGGAGVVRPAAVALMISVGIGLHNLGEGLAIGAAVGMGAMAFSTFLIVGFALHNTTEGVAIAAAASRAGTTVAKLAALGMIAGSPAIFGAWIGGFAYSPLSSVIFLSIGAGAIFQVIVVLGRWLYQESGRNLAGAHIGAGFAAGMLVMYLTSILV